jgi:hypothetical protein
MAGGRTSGGESLRLTAMSDHSDGTPAASARGAVGAGATAAGGTERPEPDWTAQVTDLIVDTVDKVRDRTTGPILNISRGSVHALVAIMMLIPVGALFVIGMVRLLNWAIPGDVWIVYAGLGTIFVALGFVLWAKRAPRT